MCNIYLILTLPTQWPKVCEILLFHLMNISDGYRFEVGIALCIALWSLLQNGSTDMRLRGTNQLKPQSHRACDHVTN